MLPPPETSFPIRKLIVIGPAVDEAAECYDKSKWIGISTRASASIELDKFDLKLPAMNYFIKSELKKYGVSEEGYALAWTENELNMVITMGYPDKRDKVFSYV